MKQQRTIMTITRILSGTKVVVRGDSGTEYEVDYIAHTCECPDYQYRHRRCKHIMFAINELAPHTDWTLSSKS